MLDKSLLRRNVINFTVFSIALFLEKKREKEKHFVVNK